MIAFYAGLILGALVGIVVLTFFAMTLKGREGREVVNPDRFTQVPRNRSKS
jgi:hypothetical protein